jgi:hypothetical protein
MRPIFVLTVAGLLALLAVTAQAQRRRFFDTPVPFDVPPNPAYDGRFTFARLKYTSGPGGYYYYGLPAWAHGYGYDPAPDRGRSERNMMKILNEISNLEPHIHETNIMPLDDPELFKYPVVYLCEPGGWYVSEDEAAAFRAYLQKGGFVIIDDFRAYHWSNFETQMHRILPDAKIVDLDVSHPIFHTFFEINSLDEIPQYYDPGRPIFRGIFEDNDPNKRLMVAIGYNTDISEFWEWSGTGFKPIDESNEAFKVGVNFFIYGMTH